MHEDAAHKDDARESTDNDGVPECARTADQSLPNGILRLGGCSHNGGRTHTTLITEQTASYTITSRNEYRGSHKASSCGRRGEGTLAYQTYGWPHIRCVKIENKEASCHIEEGHQGDKSRAESGYAANAE